jgi:hypothetical protein
MKAAAGPPHIPTSNLLVGFLGLEAERLYPSLSEEDPERLKDRLPTAPSPPEISPVRSTDPSSQTTTLSTYPLVLTMTAPMLLSSLKAGIQATTKD